MQSRAEKQHQNGCRLTGSQHPTQDRQNLKRHKPIQTRASAQKRGWPDATICGIWSQRLHKRGSRRAKYSGSPQLRPRVQVVKTASIRSQVLICQTRTETKTKNTAAQSRSANTPRAAGVVLASCKKKPMLPQSSKVQGRYWLSGRTAPIKAAPQQNRLQESTVHWYELMEIFGPCVCGPL